MLLSACGTGIPDAELYQRSVGATGPEAMALCAAIRAEALRGNCQVEAATRRAGTDPTEAQGLCEQIGDPAWREECWFRTSDAAGLTGPTAIDACERAGRFEPHCRGHALGRAVRALDAPIGEEQALEPRIADLVASYRPRPNAAQRATIARDLTALRVGLRWRERSFSMELCGAAPADLCVAAVAAEAEDRAATSIPEVCEEPPTVARVTQAGFAAWEPSGEQVAAAAWARLCADVASGRLGPETGERPPRAPR